VLLFICFAFLRAFDMSELVGESEMGVCA